MDLKDFFSILIPCLALSIALYTFLSNNPRFREYSKEFAGFVFMQLGCMLLCSFLLFLQQLDTTASTITKDFLLEGNKVVTYSLIFLFTVSWVYLCHVFYKMYGALYFMRNRRFIKYIPPFSWIYENFFHKKTYETEYRSRNLAKDSPLPENVISSVNSGGSILLLYDAERLDCLDIVSKYIISTINNGETVDYISTIRHPLEIIEALSKQCCDDTKLIQLSRKLSIIDCFSPYCAFDDKVLKIKKKTWQEKGFRFFEADSFAGIHTATNSSWYRFREQCKHEENNFRIPHRTIFNSLSGLIRFSSEEQYLLYLKHVISSEKSYGMITLLIEPNSIKKELMIDLSQMVDAVLLLEGENIVKKK